MLIFNLSRDYALRASRLSLSVILMTVFCAANAHAQNDAAPQSPASERAASTSASTATRARRVAPAQVENDKSPVKNDPASGEAGAPPVSSQSSQENPAMAEDPEAPPPLKPAETKRTDRIEALRAQIKDAKNEGERARLRRTLIDYLVALNKKRDAVEELRATAQEERFDPVGFYNIGNALARLGDFEGAAQAYRKAIDQRRGHYSRALNNLGVVLLRLGRMDEASEALTSALKLENFRYAEASYNLGRLHAARGETELAIREWIRAINAQPDHADAALALARAYAKAGSPERSIAIIDAFMRRNGSSSEFEAARREIMAAAAASGKKIEVKKEPDGAASLGAGKDDSKRKQ